MKNGINIFCLALLVIVGLVSCHKEDVLELPKANFSNFPKPFGKGTFAFKCTYTGNGQLQISDHDTIVLPLDSNLHFELFNFFKWDVDEWYVFNEFVLIEMDAKTPYKQWIELQNELRKLNLLRVVILTNSPDSITGIRKQLPPIWVEEEVYFHPDYLERFPLPPPPPQFHLSKYDTLSTAYFEIELDQIAVYSEAGQRIDFSEFVESNENVMCRYKENSIETFQQYVQITDFIFSTIYQAREERMFKDSLTRKQVKKIYPIRMLAIK